MEKRILEYLANLEREKDIEILFAVESGSRAWDFASPDSDYDIRFVYKHKREWYLNLWEQKDTIQFMTDDDLDGSGWDIRKALQLLSKSNASFLGWLFSSVVYRADEVFLQDIKELASSNFNPVSGFYHYHSMNKGFEEKLGTSEMTIKSFFYAIRTALCANWIVKNKTIPPVLLREMYSLLEEKYQKKLDDLILLKSKNIEKSTLNIDNDLINLVKNIVEENNEMKNSLLNTKPNKEDFNRFFIKNV
ncbi:nucleotidyltransferase domain-containing protein [Tenacibaculum halocynthiae]|uniref:nucleotidyltransferase domain-containing protein n=1 Tax=Tenacibaculum halocynthiae TaxID=1254437 RepID=UPI0038966211